MSCLTSDKQSKTITPVKYTFRQQWWRLAIFIGVAKLGPLLTLGRERN